MTEPTTSSAAIVAWAASLSAVSTAVIGVDSYAILWGMVGAMFTRGNNESMGRGRAIVYITLATLVGAALGTGLQSLFFAQSKPLLILASLAGGAGAQKLLDLVIAKFAKMLETQ